MEQGTQRAAVSKSLLANRNKKPLPAVTVVYVPRVHYERVVHAAARSSGLKRSPHDRCSHIRRIFNEDGTVKKIVPVKACKIHGGATEPRQHVVRRAKGVGIAVLGLEEADT